MRLRMLLASGMISLGILLIASSAGSALRLLELPMSPILFGLLGAVLLVAGLLLLITEALERWLAGGQRALVDGLQAG